MARKTKEEIARELKLARRRQRRAERKQEERAQQAEAAEAEELSAKASSESEGRVDQRALGRSQQSIAASASPVGVKSSRAQLIQAFELMGGVPELVKWGKKNPTEFYRILARIIPREADDGQTDKMPLETLLAKLAERSDQPIDQAAREIGMEALAAARNDVSLEDAVAAFRGTETVQ